MLLHSDSPADIFAGCWSCCRQHTHLLYHKCEVLLNVWVREIMAVGIRDCHGVRATGSRCCHYVCRQAKSSLGNMPSDVPSKNGLSNATAITHPYFLGRYVIPPWKWLHRELNVLRQPPTGQCDSRSKQHSRVADVWLTLRPAAPQTHPHTRTRERDRIWYRQSRGDKMRRQQQRHPAVLANARSPGRSAGRNRCSVSIRAHKQCQPRPHLPTFASKSTVVKKTLFFWAFLKTVEIFPLRIPCIRKERKKERKGPVPSVCPCGFVLSCAYMCLGLCLFLVRWSVICRQDGCLVSFDKGALPEEYLSHNFDEQCLGGH